MDPTKTKSKFKFRIVRKEQGEVRYLTLQDNGLGVNDFWTPEAFNATEFNASNIEQLAKVHNAKLEVV